MTITKEQIAASNEIAAAGWEMEACGSGGFTIYRATCGGFSSPWMDSLEEVAAWIRSTKAKGPEGSK